MAPPPSAATPRAIAFWDARRGLVGSGTCFDQRCSPGAISLTTNGGNTFRVILRTRRPVETLETAGPGGAIAELEGGATLLTLDGGATWRPFTLRYPASFATPAAGLGFHPYTLGRRAALAFDATSDGGRTWQPRRNPCRPPVAFSGLVDLVTPKLGWVVCLGQPGAGNEEKAVFRTADGGRHWQAGAAEVDYPRRNIHGGISSYGYPEGIAFAPDGFGLLWEGRGTLYVTRDGGAHWTAEPRVARPEVDFGRGAAAFSDHRFSNHRGFVLLGRGGSLPARLLATDDSGRTWNVVHRWR